MLGVYVLGPGDFIFVLQFRNLVLQQSENVMQGTKCDTLICSLLFVSRFLNRFDLFGNKSLQGLYQKIQPFHRAGKIRRMLLLCV